jgi:hypothetical protein
LKANETVEAFRMLLDLMPKGEGSQLDADMVDGLHADEIVERAVQAIKEAERVVHGFRSVSNVAHKATHLVGNSDAFDGATDELSFQVEKVVGVAGVTGKSRIVYDTTDDHIKVVIT